MSKRAFVAALFGGLAMFVWVFVAHEVLPLGETGVQEIPGEPAVLALLQSSIGPHGGVFLFPGMGLGPHPTREQQNAAMAGYARQFSVKPSGILIYHPPGRELSVPRLLSIELLTELIEVLLAVLLLAQTRLTRFASRAAFITAVGAIAAIATNVSYWNWYAFPTDYTAAYMTTQFVGFLMAGIVVAAVLPAKRPAAA